MKNGAVIWLACSVVVTVQASVSERRVSVESGSHKIEGVLFLPESRAGALCIIVPGSGAVTRDGRLIGVPATRPIYSDLASSFASRGIATFIYEKRWISRPELARTFTEEDHLADLSAIVDRMKNEQGGDRLVLFGHSEGGALAIVLAGRRKEVAAVAVAASAGFAIDELLLEQLAQNRPLREEVALLIGKMKKGSFPRGGVMLGASRDYWLQWIDFTTNMAAYARKFSAPVLVMQGSADASLPGSTLERNVASWKAISSGRADMEVKVYAGVDHFLRDTAAEQLSNPLVEDAAAFFLPEGAAKTADTDGANGSAGSAVLPAQKPSSRSQQGAGGNPR